MAARILRSRLRRALAAAAAAAPLVAAGAADDDNDDDDDAPEAAPAASASDAAAAPGAVADAWRTANEPGDRSCGPPPPTTRASRVGDAGGELRGG